MYNKQGNYIFYRQNRAFTFIEVTILITILSIILTSSLVIYSKLEEYKKVKITKNRVNKIRAALAGYFFIYNKLPCPAFLRAKAGQEFFAKSLLQKKTESCFSELSNINYNYGAVPVIDLGLEEKYLFDAWGNKISYIFIENINKLFQNPQDFPRASNLKCWIDLSAYNLLKMNQEFRVSNIYDKSKNNCNLSQDHVSNQPYYYSNFLSHRAGLLFNNITNMLFKNFLYDDLKQKYTIFLVSSQLQNTKVINTKINILDQNKFLAINNSVMKLDSNFILYIAEQSNNVVLHEFLFFNTKLSSQEINSIKSYLSLKWKIKNKNNKLLNIKSQNGQLLADDVILILISHGKNAKGSFNSYGNQLSLQKISKLEKDNIYNINSDYIFIKKAPNHWQNDFDDILSHVNYLELKILSGN